MALQALKRLVRSDNYGIVPVAIRYPASNSLNQPPHILKPSSRAKSGILATLSLATACGLLGSHFLNAAENAAPGDEAYRYHLTTLADSGTTQFLATVWPSRPESMGVNLDQLSAGETPTVARSAQAVSDRIYRGASRSVTFQLASDPLALRGFDSDLRGSSGFAFTYETASGPFTAHLSGSWLDEPSYGKETRLDGSYLALDWNDWRLGVGSPDRWWGPGWQTSLILSNNARPSPGVFFERNTHRASDNRFLKWLGPWHVTTFFNQLEGERHVPHAKLLGARFTFKPLDSLEIGLSRTAQWGGDGRPETLSNFWDLLIGNDNVGSDGIDLDGSNEPGNQLGGIDFRWTTEIADHRVSFYGQLIGEDEAGGLPSREIGMIGLDTELNTAFSNGFVFAEAADTAMNFLNGSMFNSTYNHHIYQSGYRYYGDSIGASIDNDSRLLTVGGYQEIGDKNSVTWKAHYASLNRDGHPGKNPIAPSHLQTAMLTASVKRKITDHSSVALKAHHFLDDSLPLGSGLSRSSVQLVVSLFD